MAYFYCPDCVQFFADYEGLEPITLESVAVAPDFDAHDFLADVGFEEIENGIWLSISPEEDAAYIEEFGKGFFEAFAEMGIKLEAKYCSHCGVVVIVDDGEEITEVAPFELALTVNGEYVAPKTSDNPTLRTIPTIPTTRTIPTTQIIPARPPPTILLQKRTRRTATKPTTIPKARLQSSSKNSLSF